MRLAVDHLTDKSQDIVNRIDQQATSKIGIRSLPIRQNEYTPDIFMAIIITLFDCCSDVFLVSDSHEMAQINVLSAISVIVNIRFNISENYSLKGYISHIREQFMHKIIGFICCRHCVIYY